MPTNVGNPVQSCAAPKSDYLPEQPQDPQNHFINFKLLDSKGKAMEDIVLNITLSDGTPYEGSSNDKGLIEINNIKPGTCKITFEWNNQYIRDVGFVE